MDVCVDRQHSLDAYYNYAIIDYFTKIFTTPEPFIPPSKLTDSLLKSLAKDN
ncbi:hypothetical protein FRC12_006776 [Ceratobasidium sp. 428]|nr:hypothetical protein FRC12_006776 [Ceratobasidium sp. 428]